MLSSRFAVLTLLVTFFAQGLLRGDLLSFALFCENLPRDDERIAKEALEVLDIRHTLDPASIEVMTAAGSIGVIKDLAVLETKLPDILAVWTHATYLRKFKIKGSVELLRILREELRKIDQRLQWQIDLGDAHSQKAQELRDMLVKFTWQWDAPWKGMNPIQRIVEQIPRHPPPARKAMFEILLRLVREGDRLATQSLYEDFMGPRELLGSLLETGSVDQALHILKAHSDFDKRDVDRVFLDMKNILPALAVLRHAPALGAWERDSFILEYNIVWRRLFTAYEEETRAFLERQSEEWSVRTYQLYHKALEERALGFEDGESYVRFIQAVIFHSDWLLHKHEHNPRLSLKRVLFDLQSFLRELKKLHAGQVVGKVAVLRGWLVPAMRSLAGFVKANQEVFRSVDASAIRNILFDLHMLTYGFEVGEAIEIVHRLQAQGRAKFQTLIEQNLHNPSAIVRLDAAMDLTFLVWGLERLAHEAKDQRERENALRRLNTIPRHQLQPE